MVARLILAIAALVPSIYAFENTFPVVAWSPHRSAALNRLPSSTPSSQTLLQTLLTDKNICAHDAVVFIEQPGVHAADLRSLPSSCQLAKNIVSAPSHRQFSYVRREANVMDIIKDLAMICNFQVARVQPGQPVRPDSEEKRVIHVDLPELRGLGKHRRQEMEKRDYSLTSIVFEVGNNFANPLFIYSGKLSGSTHAKRRYPGSDVGRPVLQLEVDAKHHSNVTLPEGGILKRYQFLTPGLITALLIVLFVLVPLVIVGINALGSIQSPIKLDASRDYSATTKKNQ